MQASRGAAKRRISLLNRIVRISKAAVPCTITFSGMVLGYLAVVFATRHQEQLATWLIIGAAFVDAIDGRTAKLLGATSNTGAQLDTLSDFLTFGVAPGVLAKLRGEPATGSW